MCPDIIFQILLPHSRPYDVMSCDCNVTCLFIVTKRKEIQKKRNIKSRKIDKRKIDKRKRKMLILKAFHNTLEFKS